ncbi:MAG: (2,3-dihydroxybenzoyl)adenylate synthase [Nocardioides sp.]|uniref:(2,3-dihydroxybenzoyl)adenylate synthase n=1 Tax=Nocardioides sp. TaxID=35761 RepID=UPI003F004E16
MSTRTLRSPLAPVRGWPAEERLRYRELGLWTDETLAEFLGERAARFAGRTAVVGRDVHGTPVRWTYAELDQQVDVVVARFAELGVCPGDRVVHALPNTVEYMAVVLGLFRLGAVPVFALPTHRALELAHFCTVADAAALVVGRDLAGADVTEVHADVVRRVEAAGVEAPLLVDVATWDGARPVPATPQRTARPGSEDVAFLQLSGGTTGVSKLIPRTHADYLYSVRASAEICGLDADSRLLVTLPAAHNFPMSSPGILGVLHVGGAVVMAPDPSPRTAFTLIAREGVTHASLVPPLLQAWIAAAERRAPDLGTLRLVGVGGAKLAPSVASRVAPVLGARLQQVFGMAEGLVNYTRDEDSDELVTTTQGRPTSEHDEVRVVDEDDRDVAAGEEGLLLTRGPYTIRGYYRSEQADADSFTADGFYRTGDLVRRLPSGHLVVTGRAKDQINRGGEKIASEEVENLLMTHPAVHDAVVVGVPDELLGERLAAVLVPATGASLPDRVDDLFRAHLQSCGLATYKLPDQYALVASFPTTPVGKNSRRELRRLLASTLSESSVPAVAAPQENR